MTHIIQDFSRRWDEWMRTPPVEIGPSEIDANYCHYSRVQVLRAALEKYGEKILDYKFKNRDRSYSPLEYAVLAEDKECVEQILGFGAKVEEVSKNGSMRSCLHNYVHFYWWNKNSAFKLEMLQLLLKAAKSPMTVTRDLCPYTHDYPWRPLLDVRQGLEDGRLLERTQEEEDVHFKCLLQYLELEKEHRPNDTTLITIEEFRFLATHLQRAVSQFAVDSVVACAENSPVKICLKDEKARAVFASEMAGFLPNKVASRESHLVAFGEQLTKYYGWFKALVKEGAFKDCFEKRDLRMIARDLREMEGKEAAALLSQLGTLGLV